MRSAWFAAVLFSIFLFLMVPDARAGEVGTAEAGRLSLRGTVQFLWENVQADPGRHVEGVNRFQTRRIHLGLYGEPADTISYNLTVAVDENDNLKYGVYEAYIDVRPARWLTLRTGSFLPPWTLTMPEPVHQLDFIRYPILVDPGQWLFTPWRQTGAMAVIHPGDNLVLNVGLFNGLDAANLFYDNNAMKDTMVSAGFSFFPGMRVYLGHWGGRTVVQSVMLDPGESVELPFGLSTTNNTAAPIEAGGGLVDHTSTWFGLELGSEAVTFQGEAVWHSADRNGERQQRSFGYQTSLKAGLGPVAGLVRYEFYDPNTDDTGAGAADEMEWTTLGINYQPAAWVKVMGNYIFKSERQDNQRANDEFLIQVSLAF